MNRRQFHRLSALAALGLEAPFAEAEEFDYPWKLGIITDEVSPDLGEVLKSFYPKYGLRWAEIRNLNLAGQNKYVYKSATTEQLKEIRKQLDGAGVKLSVLDTAFYKIALPGTTPVGLGAGELNPENDLYSKQMDELKRAAEAAHILGTEKVRIFDFLRVADPDKIFDRIVEELHRAIAAAKKEDVILVLRTSTVATPPTEPKRRNYSKRSRIGH